MFSGKNIVLGVTGGIAAYKACDLVSKLKKQNADVSVIMTKSACEFVSPLTFRALSGREVTTSTFQEPQIYEINHISLAQRADAIVIAPATANIIGKIASGIADDILTTTVMATKAPCIIAPAMNTAMYENPITQENIEKLSALGYIFVPPRESRLACGTVGKGALAETDDIVDNIYYAVSDKKDLKGKTVLVTAGPTCESLDPVRYLTNRSSGKMGYAVAREALRRGAMVKLVTGKTNLRAPYGAEVINIFSAQDMYDACMREYKTADIIIKAAAVGDFKPHTVNTDKIKKSDSMTVSFDLNPDILKALGIVKGDRVLIGFSMETMDLIENSRKKLESKNADMIVANNLTEAGAGFGVDTNTVTLITAEGAEKLPNMSKDKVAERILDAAAGKLK